MVRPTGGRIQPADAGRLYHAGLFRQVVKTRQFRYAMALCNGYPENAHSHRVDGGAPAPLRSYLK